MSAQPENTIEMVSIEVDGQAMQVPKNSMIIEVSAARRPWKSPFAPLRIATSEP